MDFQSRNLTVPRGKVLFARYLPGTQIPGPFKELGNTPEFTMSRETAKLSHYSSQAGMKVLDEELTTDSKLTGSLNTDDMRATNVALWFMGTVSTLTQASITATAQNETVDKGDIIQLGRTASNPAGARNVTVTTVTSNPACARYHALVTPITPLPSTRTRCIARPSIQALPLDEWGSCRQGAQYMDDQLVVFSVFLPC